MEPKQTDEVAANFVFAIINNIPPFYHSSDLRNYFSQFLETNGFECFHFKHRPEVKQLRSTPDVGSTQVDSGETQQKPQCKTFCCIVKLKRENYRRLLNLYHKKHWLDRKGDSIASLCSISEIRVHSPEHESAQAKYKTRGERRKIPEDRELVTLTELGRMPELNPPTNVMPNGNVGTPTKTFLDLIKQCKLPPKIIGKLGLTFPKSRAKRRYGNVPFEYPSSSRNKSSEKKVTSDSADEEPFSGSGHVIESPMDFKLREQCREKDPTTEDDASPSNCNHQSDEESVEDADDCEEWERHEALHDDPANVERNKERLFEEKIELKWEKGGSGLVFYTDAQFWKAQEGGDFDEETADDWDVDMSIYYDENGGDRDSRDLLRMRQEKRRRDGTEATDLKTIGFWRDNDKLGGFERHTKGIGRRVMKGQGWQEGEGLGASTSGIAEAIDTEGQHPKDKRGLGYYGEKLERKGGGIQAKKPRRDVIISTVYDNPAHTDPTEPLLRRREPYHLKHRDLSVPYQAFHKPDDPDLQILK